MSISASKAPGSNHAGPEPRDLADLLQYWRIVSRRRWLVISILVASVALGALYSLRQQKIYSAGCTLIIDMAAPRVLDQQVQDVVESGVGGYWFSKEYYETQYRIMTSRAVATRVVEKLGLRDNHSFLGLDKIEDPAARERLRQNVDVAAMVQAKLLVEPVRDSRIVRIRVEDRDPQLAASIANAAAEAYIAETLSVKSTITQSASEWLEDQLSDLDEKLEKAGQKLYEFKKANDIVSTSWEDRQSIVSQRLAAINEALSKTRVEKAQLQARHDAIRALRNAVDNDELLDTASVIPGNLLIQNLKVKYAELRSECADVTERYLKEHPKRLSCDSRLAEARTSLQREINAVLEASVNQYRETVQTERNLVQLYEQAKDEAFRFNKNEGEYLSLKHAYENNQRLYDLVLKRLKETDLSGMLQLSNVRVLDLARPSNRPIRPNVKFNLLIGLLMGILLGVGLAMGAERLDNTVRSREHVEERLGLTFLGIIPSMEPGRETSSPELSVHEQPKSAVAECCRAIRTNLLFMSPDKPLRTMVVTSSGPQDGKTTSAISMGITMAENGDRVLVIDADMRRPRVHKIFNVANGKGLSSLILGEHGIDDAIKTTEVANLSVLTCGPVPPNPAELLHTEAFRNLLKTLAGRFDRVVIDTPPVSVVTDALVVSTLVDGVILVMKAGRTTREYAQRTVQALVNVNARIFGALLNDLDLRQGTYYETEYRYGYYAEGPSPRRS